MASQPPANGNGHDGPEAAATAPDDESDPRRYTREFMYQTLVELRHEVSGLRHTVDLQRSEMEAMRQTMMNMANMFMRFETLLSEARAETSAMATAAASARYEAAEAATDARASRLALDEERRAAYRAGVEGRPLETIPPPRDRDTDPALGRYSSKPPEPQ